ncbi:hypothetical protein [Arthrobacter sp. SLBN-53]|uniref:hypothetical protein n=1 Tax=Arthrobacter sp. SLBN-53 TaxID=2768412 RepID=UPI001151F1C3|nr:hypothetical protein [Arthrobacter sp. SLBN-53]TQK28995.1 hypothetical protein FBY28_1992 [Arthrobacter sp. SLBN-53]
MEHGSENGNENGIKNGSENRSDPPANPADATEATADQRQVQDQLDRRHEDPDGPGLHQSRRQIADET